MDEARDGASHLALTGATGFIGRTLQARLAAAGYRVRALVRPRATRPPPFAPGVQPLTVALDDAAGLRDALTGVGTVIHCAGSVRGAGYADFVPANVAGVAALCAAAAQQHPPPRIILISSLAASEPALSDYARSKREGEKVLEGAPALAWTILRPPAVYGPGDREMLPLLGAIRAGIAPIVGPPGQRVSLLHVDDLADAVLACLAHPTACARRIFAIDDGRPAGYGWEDLIAAGRGGRPALRVRVPPAILFALARVNLALSRWRGRAPMLTPGKVRELSHDRWLCDNAPFTAATGWAPQIGLEAGMERLFGRAATDGSDSGAGA
jgi:nucleoside-diphosphate-sugar epimerase